MAKTKPKKRTTSSRKNNEAAKLRAQIAALRKRLKAVQSVKARKPRGLKAKKPVRLKAKKPRASLKVKAGVRTRKVIKAIRKFAKGATTKIKYPTRSRKSKRKKPVKVSTKEQRLRDIGVRVYKGTRARTVKQKRKISAIYSEFSEFVGRKNRYFKIIRTDNADTLTKARKSGMAVYDNNIYVHIARSGERVKLGRKLGEKIIHRTYYNKAEKIFIGGADVFDRVVEKLQVTELPPDELITGAFFGGPTFHRAIYNNVGDFLNYMNNQFIPHLDKGVKPTKRNIARAKADLMKNIAIVQMNLNLGGSADHAETVELRKPEPPAPAKKKATRRPAKKKTAKRAKKKATRRPAKKKTAKRAKKNRGNRR